MKTKAMVFVLVICFSFFNSLNAQVIGIEWNTFLGSGNTDLGYDIVLDGSGNIYMTGIGSANWGTPTNAFSGGEDAVVTCLDSSGNLLWHTFLGSSLVDRSFGICLDSSGNVYVAGFSDATWGSPVNAHSGGYDIFVACLDNSGNLTWHTFLGSTGGDFGLCIALDGSGKLYVCGYCDASWGSPVNAHSGGWDAFVACLDSSGNLIWNTFLGGGIGDFGRDLTLDSSGNIYLSGFGDTTWGSPVNSYSGGRDAFVACLDSSGNLIWNTFLGSSDDDWSYGIVRGSTGNIYIVGQSSSSWGSPVNAYSSARDALVVCLDSSGNLIWNTFFGSAGDDLGYGIDLDNSGNIYMVGSCPATWGSPVNAHSGNGDAFTAGLDSSGNLLWNTFLGSSGMDTGRGIITDSSGNIYITGNSDASWGSPLNAHSGSHDVFAARITPKPIQDITANGSDSPISITESDTLQIRVSLISYGITDNVDYWLAYKGPAGWVHYNNSTKKWETGLGVTHQGALMDLNNKKVFQSKLSPGNYTFYFGVDMNMNGKVTKSSLYKDEVQVTVTSN